MRSLVVVLVALLHVLGCGSGSSDWVQQDVPAPTLLTAYTVWAAGDGDVWLGGSSMWHFDGAAWAEAPVSTPASVVLDIWGLSPDDIWAISDTRVFHWSGSAWSEVAATAGVTFTAMWRLWASSSTDVWIANQDNSRVYHYDGAAWTVTTLQFVQARALWGSSAHDIWLTGINELEHYDGSTWNQPQGTTVPVGGQGIWGFGPDDVWIAGSFDPLVHWDGTAWTPVDEDHERYNGIWGRASDDVYAVGDTGVVAHFDGSSWSTSQAISQRQNFTKVHGSSATNVWATAVDLEARKALLYRYEP